MADRFAFYDPVPILDLDEDGLPCYPEPDEPICPVLKRWILKAQSVREVSEAFGEHEAGCPVCERRAA